MTITLKITFQGLEQKKDERNMREIIDLPVERIEVD
jgi:hypothetical protein